MDALIQHLLTLQLVPEKTLKQAQLTSKNSSLINYLARNKLVPPATLALAAAKIFNMPIKDLTALSINNQSISLISPKMIFESSILPIGHNAHSLDLAMSDPSDIKIIEAVQFMTGLHVNVLLVDYHQLQQWIQVHVIEKRPRETISSTHPPSGDSSTVHFVNSLIKQAVQTDASDIHIELFETYCRIRFRQNGLLSEILKATREQALTVISRLKLLASLNIAEKRLPQDGHCKIHLDETNAVDIRINSCPTIHGEKLVLRLLNTEKIFRSIDQIDLLDHQKPLFLKAVQKNHGLILVTGPTGSGKTVTLYALLSHLNKIDKNISTVEDPVEIHLPGTNQVNINLKSGLTFASVLRAFLRQDPDIIMLGEIRDLETATLAIRAAQTGRLVLSTLHTDSAVGALMRLQNMGVEAYNLASAITFISAQRLIRKLCPDCKQVSPVSSSALKAFSLPPSIPIFKAAGCPKCQGGYLGRIAVHEAILLDEPSTAELLNRSKVHLNVISKSPPFTLQQAAIERIKTGETSLEEVMRLFALENQQENHG